MMAGNHIKIPKANPTPAQHHKLAAAERGGEAFEKARQREMKRKEDVEREKEKEGARRKRRRRESTNLSIPPRSNPLLESFLLLKIRFH